MSTAAEQEQLTVSQAATALGVSYRWANRLVVKGRLAADFTESKRGREWRIPASEVERYRLERNQRAT